MNNNDLINEVRRASDIVEVISSYLPLIKKGKNHFGVCPFHDDNNPSMSVTSDKQIYKCFSCGAGGNVFTFVMDYEKIEFKEALNILAKRAGISINNISLKSINKYDKYFKMYDLALKLYQNNLNTELGKPAKDYLYKRDINEEIIKTFKIGLAGSDNSTLTKLLTRKDYTLKDIEMLGLGNGRNDLFINRIMFPLFDISNKVVGFSGRVYNLKSDSKYINTKETVIFKKGEILYNYYNAKDIIRNEKKLIIVEGFIDVIRLYTIGIKNVIALMGTALTKEQLILLKRLSNNIYLSLDGDSAGRKATYTIGNQLEFEGINPNIIFIPDNLDPDEFIMSKGKDEYISLYNNPMPFSDFKINYLKEGQNLTTLEDKSKYINKVLEEISLIRDEIKQELMLKKISLEFDIDIEILRNKLQTLTKYSKINATKKVFQNSVNEIKLDKYRKATYMILGSMINSYEITKYYEKKLNYLPYSEARYLANEIIYYYKMNGELVLADFITTLNDKKDLYNLLQEILRYEIGEIDNSIVDEYFNVIRKYNSRQQIIRLKKELKDTYDETKKAEIAEKIRLLKMGVES